MPVIESQYKAPYFFRKGFVSTVYSGLARSIKNVEQRRERITLPDGDFLDLDWSFSQQPATKVIVLLHGLEGHAQRPYITGTAKLFNENGMDAVAVNFRGCSGETNKLFRSYHSGATEDLDAVIQHLVANKTYSSIYIKGVSLGGNMLLKYLGEGRQLPSQVKAGIAVSVPCYLEGSAKELHNFKNKPYHDRFKKHLVDKLWLKSEKFPSLLSEKRIKSIKTLSDFDEVYTSKAHGFMNAKDYYAKSSCLQFLPNITVPSLIINALNDSFLSPECYPVKQAKSNPNLFLEMPKHGGHVGFIDKKNVYYNEKQALNFITERQL